MFERSVGALAIVLLLGGMAHAGERIQLPRDTLASSAPMAQPVDLAAFAPASDAKAPSNRFEGRLTFTAERDTPGFKVVRDVAGYARVDATHHLPPFDFTFVQSGDALIPARRGPIASSDPANEFVLEPGRVWDEPGDGGFSRAAIPFSLEEKNANCLHNGVMTFLFRSDGAISDVAFEIASETCMYFQFDLWGRMAARYTPEPVAGAASLEAVYAREVAARLPAKPLADIVSIGGDPSRFGVGIVPADMTLYGVVADGTNYVSACNTRMGVYPYCDVMDLPSYSVAKSLVAGVATMRLAALYSGVTDEHIADYVPECAAVNSWSDVRFGQVLDMASGHFNSPKAQADEDAPDIAPFFLATSHTGRIGFSCNHYPRKADPGTQWVYHTADTYLLGTALNGFLRSKRGADADFYRDIVDPIWRTLELSPTIDVTRRTYDAAAQPFTGFGLAFHRDDIARIARFLNNDHGAASGTQWLDQKMLDAALQRDPQSPGIRAIDDNFRYHNGFWAWNAQAPTHCTKPVWIPYMSGFGGITVAMMPNGMTYYYFSDGGTFAWAAAAAELNRMRPFCGK